MPPLSPPLHAKAVQYLLLGWQADAIAEDIRWHPATICRLRWSLLIRDTPSAPRVRTLNWQSPMRIVSWNFLTVILPQIRKRWSGFFGRSGVSELIGQQSRECWKGGSDQKRMTKSTHCPRLRPQAYQYPNVRRIRGQEGGLRFEVRHKRRTMGLRLRSAWEIEEWRTIYEKKVRELNPFNRGEMNHWKYLTLSTLFKRTQVSVGWWVTFLVVLWDV